jgi:hypothetical protein
LKQRVKGEEKEPLSSLPCPLSRNYKLEKLV